jgi:2OG-Fe(II) oxygenase superfamily
MIAIKALNSNGPDLRLGSAEELAELREHFEREHCVRLRGLIQRPLLEQIIGRVDEATFEERRHGEIGTEECMKGGTTLALLLLVANDERLFDAIRTITGCGSIGCFDGRVYRLVPGTGHHDSWHSDMDGNRMIAMSVNLSPVPYDGGVLQIREQDSGEIVHEEPAPDPGDAIIFRLAEELRHRVTQVEGDVPRTAFAGWFKARPTLLSVLKGGDWSS